MVRCIDHSVKNVVDAMKQRGLWENTILVFFSGMYVINFEGL